MSEEKKAKLTKDALEYHARAPAGKIGTCITKDLDLNLAYTPGVAAPCREIADEPDAAYKYTAKGNLVGIISNGSAVLGLGDIGPRAAKPVMEGKAVLFKHFGEVDAYDIEVDAEDADTLVDTIVRIAPTFGGINLEDIKAPLCFEVERRLKDKLDIPVFHDDQHGTAVVLSAGLLNALHLQGKKLEDVRIVCAGAGAAGIASMDMLLALGAKREHILLVDSKGVIYEGREHVNEYKAAYAAKSTDARSLGDAMKDADVFVGLSGPDLVSQDMVRSMADKPIIFALSNPDPEIKPDDARAARDDVIMATGRSDYPNQINNVLCFPFLFRGALDVHARTINEQMNTAAARALSALAREDIPEDVQKACNLEKNAFGPTYLLPTPLDSRLRMRIASAVARAAVDSGAARIGYPDHYPPAPKL